MNSTKQVEANRKNAVLSTGPKTQEGLRVSSMNAKKHGLFAKEALTDMEDYFELEEFAEGLRGSFLPQDDFEQLLVERIISCAWRLRRILKVEASLFRSNGEWETCFHPSQGSSFETERGDRVLLLSRYETALERSLYRALSELRQIQVLRDGRALPPTLNMNVSIDERNGFVS